MNPSSTHKSPQDNAFSEIHMAVEEVVIPTKSLLSPSAFLSPFPSYCSPIDGRFQDMGPNAKKKWFLCLPCPPCQQAASLESRNTVNKPWWRVSQHGIVVIGCWLSLGLFPDFIQHLEQGKPTLKLFGLHKATVCWRVLLSIDEKGQYFPLSWHPSQHGAVELHQPQSNLALPIGMGVHCLLGCWHCLLLLLLLLSHFSRVRLCATP